MYMHVDYKQAPNYEVIDLDNEKRIPFVQWANDENGTYEVLLQNNKGDWIEEWVGDELLVKRELRRGNIKLVRKSKEE